MDIIGVKIIEDEQILHAAAGGDGELASLVGVYFAGDGDASWKHMLASRERLW